MTYAKRVRELESEGLTTSDAQAAADAEQRAGRAFDFDDDHPADTMPRAATLTVATLDAERADAYLFDLFTKLRLSPRGRLMLLSGLAAFDRTLGG